MPPDAFIQYGCFGLLAALVVWSIWHGIPAALATHRETMMAIVAEHKAESQEVANSHAAAVAKIVAAFQSEQTQCREERLATAASAATERELDRKIRHELMNRLQTMLEQRPPDHGSPKSGKIPRPETNQ